jgi:glycine/D-amino acid oxidase-like deaminating enzyme
LQPLLLERSAEIVAFEIQNCTEVSSYILSENIDCDYRSVSACRTFWTTQELEHAEKSIQKLQTEAPELAKSIQLIRDEEGLLQAGVLPTCPGATITQGAASLWPYKYVTSILSNMIDRGKVNLQTNTPVLRVKPCKDQGNARYLVETDRGSVTAKNLLLATNAYTSHLLPEFADLIIPVRETMTALIPPTSQTELLPHSYGIEALSPIANGTSGEYLIQKPSKANGALGELMLGGGRTFGGQTLPSVGEADDSVVDPAVVSYLKAALPKSLTLRSYPSSSKTGNSGDLDEKAAWTGIWAASRDGNPFVGPVPEYPDGIWLCAAYTGHGMPNATLCAKAVVRMMLAADGLSSQEADRTIKALQEDMIAEGDLPACYFISKERIKRARELPTTQEQDTMGIMGMYNVDE